MAQKIRVQHIRTGKETTFTEEQWNKIKDDPNWFGTYKEIQAPEAPPEAKAAKEKAAEAQTPAADSKTTPAEKK